MTDILTPLEFGAATKLGPRHFRKQILPLGKIKYHGKWLNFDRDYLDEIERAFREGAHDAVNLVAANEKNTHTLAPEAVTGQLVDMEVRDDGLWGIIRSDPDTAQMLEDHPEIGISARIKQDYERSDGAKFKAALQHVLITTDPHIAGMAPWEKVDLAHEAEHTIDLSTYSFAGPGEEPETHEEAIMADTETSLSTDELAELKNLLPEMRNLLSAVRAAETDDEDFTDADIDAADDFDISEEEIEAIANEVLADEPETVAASHTDEALELANARTSELEVQLANMQSALDAREFEAEKDRLIRDCGIPPVVVDLARPLLEGSHTVELANGDEADAGKIVRDMFTALAELNLVDLSQAAGHAFETDATRSEAEQRKAWSSEARAELGI